MSEVDTVGPTDLLQLYNELLASSDVRVVRKGSAKQREYDPVDVDNQCRQIDELWEWLHECYSKWSGYDDAFIASRFANMHYRFTPKTGYAYPPEPVWTHLLSKIAELRMGIIVQRAKTFTPGEVIVWS